MNFSTSDLVNGFDYGLSEEAQKSRYMDLRSYQKEGQGNFRELKHRSVTQAPGDIRSNYLKFLNKKV